VLNDPITSVCPSLWERYVSEGETETLVNCEMMETSINGSVALSIAKPDMKKGFLLHAGKLIWNLKPWFPKRNLLFKGAIFRFYLHFQGCKPKAQNNKI